MKETKKLSFDNAPAIAFAILFAIIFIVSLPLKTPMQFLFLGCSIIYTLIARPRYEDPYWKEQRELWKGTK